MRPLVACILGMMIGTIVLLGTTIYKPHDLSLFQACCEKHQKY